MGSTIGNMIKIYFSLIVFLFLLFYVALPKADPLPRQEMKAFMQTLSARKINIGLQRELLLLEEKNAVHQRLDLLIGLKTSLTETEKAQLQQEGVILRSVIGTIATATAPAEKIPAVASFDFIEYIELSTRLQMKGDLHEKP